MSWIKWCKLLINTIQGIHTARDTGHPSLKKGKLNLVDLAGSERHGKTGVVHVVVYISETTVTAFNFGKLWARIPANIPPECQRTAGIGYCDCLGTFKIVTISDIWRKAICTVLSES